MNAPAETAPAPATNPAYLRVLEALVQINEPAERNHIARRAGISPDDAGVQLVALAGNRIVVRCPQPKGAPALWSLAVSLSTVRQMVDGMKRAAAEASPAADDRRRIIAAMREIGAPASAFGIAKKSGVEMPNFSLFLEEMAADGVIQRIGGTSGQRPKFALAPSVQSLTPTATDGEPGDGTPAPEPDDTQAEDRRRAVLEALREAPEANADSIASATGLSVSEARFFLHAMAADGIVERIEHENAGAIRRNPTIWRIVDADQPGDTQVVDAAEAAPVPDHSASLDDPDNFGDGEMPTAAPGPDGWIPWNGGDCPVSGGTMVFVRIRHGGIMHDFAGEFFWKWSEHQRHPGDITDYRLDKPTHAITPTYSAVVAAEFAADAAPLTGDDVCSTDAVIADWKREHAPAAPAAPADPDTPLGCAIARITGPLIAQAEEWESDALRLRRIIGEAIRLASDAQARTPGVSEAHKALEIAASIIEDVQ